MTTSDTLKLIGNAVLGMVIYFTLLMSPML